VSRGACRRGNLKVCTNHPGIALDGRQSWIAPTARYSAPSGAALEFYRSGVGIAELSPPDGFDGVLPQGLIDNRPFLRCLHGLALCAWRQRRWDDAESIFTGLVWLDPTGSTNALACLESVRARHRWERS